MAQLVCSHAQKIMEGKFHAWYEKKSVARKMENKLAVGEKYNSFYEFVITLNDFSQKNFVSFQKKGCRVISHNAEAAAFYNPYLKYLSCKYECEFKPNGCPAMIQIRAVDRNNLRIESSILTHNHSCGIHESRIRRTCSDIEKHLLFSPQDQKEMKLGLLADLLEQWTKGNNDYQSSRNDNSANVNYVSLPIVSDVVLYINSLPPDSQLEKITELRSLLDDWFLEEERIARQRKKSKEKSKKKK